MEQLESGRKRSATSGEGGSAFRRRQNLDDDFDRDMAEAARDLAATVKTVAKHHVDEKENDVAMSDIPAAAAPGTVKRGPPPSARQTRRTVTAVRHVKPKTQGRVLSRKPPSVQRRRAPPTRAPPKQMVSNLRTTQRKSRAITYTNAPGLREWLQKQTNLQHRIEILLSQGKFKEAEKLRLRLIRRKYNL
jgi:hypothetical protein